MSLYVDMCVESRGRPIQLCTVEWRCSVCVCGCADAACTVKATEVQVGGDAAGLVQCGGV